MQERVDYKAQMDTMHGAGSLVILMVTMIVGVSLRFLRGTWQMEDILLELLFAGMGFWFSAAWRQLRVLSLIERSEFVKIGKKLFWMQIAWWALWNWIIGWFSTIFIFSHEFVADSPLVIFHRGQTMPISFMLVWMVIFFPFTIGYPLAILIVNKVMKKEEGK